MSFVKISQLPDGPWREYALEAQRRGIEKIGDCQLRGTDVMLIGGKLLIVVVLLIRLVNLVFKIVNSYSLESIITLEIDIF